MRIVLEREYWPTSTHGSIFIDDKLICYTLESPKIPGCSKDSCLPEGSYLMLKEDQLPILALKKGIRSDYVGAIIPDGPIKVEMSQVVKPVESIKSEGIGNNSQKAFKRLLQALGKANSAQDTFRLEIRSCPDKALNLACCEIAWMD
ncbi:hypothetical protein SAMN04488104_10277 [Algoriphagus faecimaris]|uniref:DUF5675 domain-containing protein n=1 Tax=Algoriphagus faecimaris TaxID=686796 RepID=A0A1G6U8E2_9BACT|nr:DUF5675 family protein [Algoriphagus faecimaris]SDD37662.1 hypothetical protein SAMN04488104_10277 [Algoriphagus faecimaris]